MRKGGIVIQFHLGSISQISVAKRQHCREEAPKSDAADTKYGKPDHIAGVGVRCLGCVRSTPWMVFHREGKPHDGGQEQRVSRYMQIKIEPRMDQNGND